MASLKKLTRVGADVRQIARLLQAKAPEGHMLAYITPEEAKLLKSQGGSGKEHADTGVPSFEIEDSGGFDTGGFIQDSGGYDTAAFENQPPPLTQNNYTVPLFGGGQVAEYKPFIREPDVDLGFQSGTTPANVDLNQAAPATTSQATPTYTGDMSQYAGAFPAGSFETQPGVSTTPYQIDTTPPKTIGDRMDDLSKSLGISKNMLGTLGIAGAGALYNAYQSNKAQKEAEKAKKEQRALGAPYQAKGAEMQRAAQAGELTPAGQQQLQAAQAQLAQQSAGRGGAGAAQTATQIENLRNQLLAQQYDYGLKLSSIGDQVALGAIKTGLEADRYVQQLNSSFYTNMMYMLGGMQPPAQAQQRTT